MTSRPKLATKRRPSSAIFLGSLPPPNLPDLPEPPSPGAASNHSASGLPSPPATNSTGSGSTGDNSQDGGSLRRRSTSDMNPSNGTSSKRQSSPERREADDDDEDNTAKLTKRSSTSSENADALKRVLSLTKRNREVSSHLLPFLISFGSATARRCVASEASFVIYLPESTSDLLSALLRVGDVDVRDRFMAFGVRIWKHPLPRSCAR